jgi:hypothetical protein
MHRQGLENIPDVKTCTDKLQMWHVRKPTSDEPLLFSDIKFVRHDPEKPVKRDLCVNLLTHNPVPDFHKTVTNGDLEKLVKVYDMSGIKLPILDVIRDNKFAPVIQKQQMDAELHSELFAAMTNGDHYARNEFGASVSDAVIHHYNAAVDVDLDRSLFIEKSTRLQSKSNFWFAQREYRLTASMFGTFCRLRSTTDPVKTFMQKRKYFTTKSVRHGLNYESQAFAKYCEQMKCDSSSVGLIINPDIPYLAVSPDGLVKVQDQLRLVEIKCPYSLFQRKSKIKDQLKEKNFYLSQTKDGIKLKETHDYFYQIQGQLNVAQIQTCDLVVFVPPNDIVIVHVEKDAAFFRQKMLPKLAQIYFEKLLPHFIDELNMM